MNFVGTEVSVPTTSTEGIATHSHLSLQSSSGTTETDDGEDDGNVNEVVRDWHPPISPKSGAEQLFLGMDLDTQQISAFALAQQIHQQYRVDASGTTTVGTEDYQTAAAASPEHSTSCLDNDDLMFLNSPPPPILLPAAAASSLTPENTGIDPFRRDALCHSRDLLEDHSNHNYSSYEELQFHDAKMTSSSSPPNTTTNTPSYTAEKTDPAEKVYDTAKSVWGWGKSVAIFRPFLGLAEGVASKVVGVAFGSNLEQVDGNIQKQLGDIDGKYLNPAIAAIVAMLLGTVSKSEEILKPLLQTLLKPVKLIKKDPENNTPPEVTTSPTAPTIAA